MAKVTHEFDLYGKHYVLETGELAKQATGSCLVKCGDSTVLLTAVVSKERKDYDFFPLTVDFIEKMYAVGRIPGGYLKREARPSEKATLTARMIDRPLRPSFPAGFRNEVQVVATTLVADQVNPVDTICIMAASAALTVGGVPFEGPLACVRIGRDRDTHEFIVNPTYEERDNSDLDLELGGSCDFISMLEAGAEEISEEDMLAAMAFGQEAIAAFSRFLPRTQDPARQAALRLERGRAYHALGQLERAREDFAAVSAAADPAQAAEARFFLVLCLYGLGEDERARALAQEYLAAYPDSPRVPDMILWLAKSDFNRGDYAAAAKGFEAFAERWPGDPRVPNARFLAARAAYQGEAYAHAVELVGALAKATPQAPILPDARFLQAEALIELARHGEAAELLAALIRRTPEAPWLGDAYGRLGDCLLITATDDPERYAQALQNYREARLRLEQDPDAAAMYDYKIGRVYEKQGRPDAAAEQYARLLYGAIAAPARLAEPGRDWLRKARARLAAIEIPRGNRAAYDNLLRRLRAADLL